jgi:hypothetical protein
MRKEEKKVSDQKLEEKTSFDGKKVKVLGTTYDPGIPDKIANWRDKLKSREEMLAYLKVGVR